MRPLATVVGRGAVTPVALDAVANVFAHRAASTAMREAPLLDAAGEPITMCFLPTLDPLLTGGERALALAIRALDEALLSIGPDTPALRVKLAIALDEHVAQAASRGDPTIRDIARQLGARARARFPEIAVETSARGAAGPGLALPGIFEGLAAGTFDAAILGGVHTDYDPERIQALSGAGRLFRSDNLDALIPGEAAAFVVLMRPDTARRLRLRGRADLVASATGTARARPDNDEPAFRATALTAAIRSACAPLAAEGLAAGWVLTDLTFETFRVFELQAATTRNQRLFCEPQRIDNPAQRMGHLGAAATPLHLAIAAESFRRGLAPHPYGLSITGSDGGERAAVLFSAAE